MYAKNHKVPIIGNWNQSHCPGFWILAIELGEFLTAGEIYHVELTFYSQHEMQSNLTTIPNLYRIDNDRDNVDVAELDKFWMR